VLPRNLFHRCLARCRRSASDRAAWVTLAALALGLGPTSLGEAAQLTLTWTDHSGGQTAFAIERKTGPGGVYAPIGQSAAGVATYVDTTVATGTTYCYRVRAFNEAGTSDYSNEACTNPPGGLELTVIGAEAERAA
jgi:hypothetical protein